MRFWTLLVLLTLPPCTWAQVVVEGIAPQDLAAARALLARAVPKPLQLAPGEFEVLEPAPALTVPLLWLLRDEATVQPMHVAPQQPLALWMKRRGERAPRLHQFPARPLAWVVLVGTQPGSTLLHVIRSGENQSAPVVVDAIQLTVVPATPLPDEPVPLEPPVEPPSEILVQALRQAWRKDQAAGQAEVRWLQALARLYAGAGRDSLEHLRTADDLDAHLYRARQAAGIPEPERMLPQLRLRLRQELLSALELTDADGHRLLTPASRAIARKTFTRLARALEVLP